MNDTSNFYFTIPGQVIAKQSVKFTRAGIKYTPSKVTNYANWVKLSFLQEHPNFKPLDTALRVLLTVSFAIPQSYSKKKTAQALAGEIRPTVKPDCDNIAKNVLDSLNGLAWCDDKQITDLRIVKQYGESAFVKVEIEAL